jgi:hypothetical protein
MARSMLFFRGGPMAGEEPSTIIEGDVPDATLGTSDRRARHQRRRLRRPAGCAGNSHRLAEARSRAFASTRRTRGKPIVPIWEHTPTGSNPAWGAR